MGGLNDGISLLCQRSGLFQHQKLVAEVQVGGWLVQHQNGGILHQRPSDQHQLLLTAGKPMEAPVCQMGYTDLFQSPTTFLRILFTGTAEGRKTAGSAHKDNIKHTVIKNWMTGLRNVGNMPGRFPDRKRTGIDAIHQNLPGVAG